MGERKLESGKGKKGREMALRVTQNILRKERKESKRDKGNAIGGGNEKSGKGAVKENRKRDDGPTERGKG